MRLPSRNDKRQDANDCRFYLLTKGCGTLFPRHHRRTTVHRPEAFAPWGVTSPALAILLFSLMAVLPRAARPRVWKWAAHILSAARWGRDFFFGRRTCRRIAGNFAERYFAKRYPRASLIHVNRRSSPIRSVFKLNYDEIIRVLDIFAVPDFAAWRTPAIQIDGARVGFGMTGTYDLRYAASGKFPIDDGRKHILKVRLAVSGCRPNALIFLRDSPISHR